MADIVYYHHVDDIAAFVLAGGNSSRMGEDKAFLHVGSGTLLEHALELARGVSREVHIVGCQDKFADFAPVVQDIFPAHGPLGGIHAALATTGCELNLLLAVDMPFITPQLLAFLVKRAQAGAALVTVPRVNGGFQPLCAVYRRAFLYPAEEALRAGRNKIDLLFKPEVTEIVDESELSRLEFHAAMFDNLNTREDLQRALRRTHE